MLRLRSLGLLLALCLLGHIAASELPTGPWPYPPAAPGPVVDDYHGTKVPDPYRWLEDLDSASTRAWVGAENRLTSDFLRRLPQREWFRTRLARLWNTPRYGVPFKEGGRYFFTKNDGLQNQSVLYVQEGLGGPPRALFDPNLLAADGTVALTAAAVSHDGRWLAYATAAAGSDWNEIRVRNVATGQDTGDVLRWIKFSGPSWTRDGRGFFYSRYPAADPGGGAQTFAALAHQSVYYHRLGEPQSRDRLIYEIPGEPKWFVGASVTEDGRYAVLVTNRGDSDNNLLGLLDLGTPAFAEASAGSAASAKATAAPVPLVTAWDGEDIVIGNDGPVLYVQTNLGAPRRRIVAIDVRHPAPSGWRTIVPESPDVIESSALIGGELVVLRMHDASSRLLAFGRDGILRGEIVLPGLGTVSELSGHEDDPELFYDFTSFTLPAVNFRHDLATGRSEVFQSPTLVFDPSRYETTQVFYPSKDGTRIPMFITARKGMKLDGTAPTLLYAYGGFDISITPAYSVTSIVWLELGGIYAVPNLRGGGEYGRQWHEAGTKERKQNVFDDYVAAAEWLFARRYTSPSRLVISGASNGGLLIGATLNQRPDLCRVAWPAVGVMDMLRFQKFTIGYAWVSDYGSSDDPAEFKALLAYSPVHTVRKGAHYPAVLVTTGDHDDRVFPAHSFKYTAALQASVYNGPGSLPVLIRIETRAGHGMGKPVTKLIDESADKLAFAAHFLDLHPEAHESILPNR